MKGQLFLCNITRSRADRWPSLRVTRLIPEAGRAMRLGAQHNVTLSCEA